MAKLTARRRRALPAKAFAYPKQRKYPVQDRQHAAAALREAAKPGTFGTRRHVQAKVCARYPSMASCRRAPAARSRGRS